MAAVNNFKRHKGNGPAVRASRHYTHRTVPHTHTHTHTHTSTHTYNTHTQAHTTYTHTSTHHINTHKHTHTTHRHKHILHVHSANNIAVYFYDHDFSSQNNRERERALPAGRYLEITGSLANPSLPHQRIRHPLRLGASSSRPRDPSRARLVPSRVAVRQYPAPFTINDESRVRALHKRARPFPRGHATPRLPPKFPRVGRRAKLSRKPRQSTQTRRSTKPLLAAPTLKSKKL